MAEILRVSRRSDESSPLSMTYSEADDETYITITADEFLSPSLNSEANLVNSLDESKTLVAGENHTQECHNADGFFYTEANTLVNSLDESKTLVAGENHTQECHNADGFFYTGKSGKRKFSPNSIVLAWKKHTNEFIKKEKKHKNRKNRRPEGTPKVDLTDPSEFIVARKYRLIEFIGNGSFGELYQAVDIKKGEEVAVKVECITAAHSMLEREAKVYKLLAGAEGIPKIRYYGPERDVNVLVLDLLGPSLEDLLNFCTRTFSLKTTVMLALQMLARLECVHQNGYIHRDIKPDNFLMGLDGQRCQVYLIDFGLAKKFYDPHSGKHIEYCQKRELVGTPRYSSARSHFAEQGRRDDLESLGYMLIYFRRGRLPWQGIRAVNKAQKFEQIGEMKASITMESLCNDMPGEFMLYLRYCRGLHFVEMPDYVYLLRMFQNILFRKRLLNDFLFDWVDLKHLAIYQRDCVVQRGNVNCCSCSYHKYQRRLDHQRHRYRVHHPTCPL
ncbi:casein kinase I isoform X2 [Drosophila miranda]|uniref:casein kinase I isoform X2 n=1 Tax=Drosophila miranda TaxID=7229 RepID=UPI00143F1460|nr:casein kinase I isoform X2 [Drosophila miranda]